MGTTTIRVSERTHDVLRALAASTGEPMARLVERAVEHLRAEEFFAHLDDAYGRLRGDAVTWAEEVAERTEWEATLADGLEADDG
jgi:predicted DNA-binding protein